MRNFESFLAPKFNDFIEYRKSLGYSVKGTRSYLLRFDRYVKERKIKPGILQPSFFLEFKNSLEVEPTTINHFLSAIRVFFKFMVRTDCYTLNPLEDIPPVPEWAYAPFIFSSEQTDQLVEAVCRRIRKETRHYLKDFSEYLAIVLMARCGLRIKEPLKLQLHHYRRHEKSIYIEKTKFYKDRLIPVPKSVAADLDNYLAVRNALMSGQNPYLLVRNQQIGLNDPRMRFVFHRAIRDICMDRHRQVIGTMIFASPTPHSLRHSFAVNLLKRIKDGGGSPQHALPVLSTYMGHRRYHNTARYLKFIDAQQRQGLLDFAESKKKNI
jgi:integrase/recombinase XerD